MSKPECVPKLIGGDIELGNFLLGTAETARTSDFKASRLLLREVDGLPRKSDDERHSNRSPFFGGYGYWDSRAEGGYYSQDWGRRYLPSNGGCIYIDLNHLELATPEVTSARDHQAVWMAMLRIARRAQEVANDALPDGQRAVVLANNSDRQGNSYGAHQSFLMSLSLIHI